MFHKVEGHVAKINAKAINAGQMKLVEEIIKWNKGESKIRRKDLKQAHNDLRGKLASPYFIAKNEAIQVKGELGMYDLSRFKLAAAATKPVVAKKDEEAPPVKKGGKKKPAAKKESKGKKGAATTTEPAATEETKELQPA